MTKTVSYEHSNKPTQGVFHKLLILHVFNFCWVSQGHLARIVGRSQSNDKEFNVALAHGGKRIWMLVFHHSECQENFMVYN